MLVKMLLNCPGNFEKTLKLRRLMALGFLALGVIGIGCYFLLIPGSGLPEFAQGFYLGAASGCGFGGLLLLIRTQHLLSHPEKQRQARIKEQDEREQTIKNQAFRLAGIIVFFGSAAALFVALPLSRDVFRALLAVMVVYCFSFLAGVAYYSKRT